MLWQFNVSSPRLEREGSRQISKPFAACQKIECNTSSELNKKFIMQSLKKNPKVKTTRQYKQHCE